MSSRSSFGQSSSSPSPMALIWCFILITIVNGTWGGTLSPIASAFPSPTTNVIQKRPAAVVLSRTSEQQSFEPQKEKQVLYSFTSSGVVHRWRGGQQDQDMTTVDSSEASGPNYQEQEGARSLQSETTPALGVFAALGQFYGKSLEMYPIWTKSWTSGIIFGISDYLAQRVEARGKSAATSGGKKVVAPSINWTRTLYSFGLGLLYFGPAAHYWYEMVFQLLPSTDLLGTLQKAAMGQLIFGPVFTCIYFASSLLQGRTFSLSNWWSKIRQDLPGAWIAGAGYWTVVDLISYSLIPKNFIPLFVNMCSLIWTIYLSIIANRVASNEDRL